jgi:hypothetical protein
MTGEPLVRTGNVTGALVAAVAYGLGYPRIGLMLVALNGLDVVGRQVSEPYAAFVRNQSGPTQLIAGLGLVENVFGVNVPTVRPWVYDGLGVPLIRKLRGSR